MRQIEFRQGQRNADGRLFSGPDQSSIRGIQHLCFLRDHARLSLPVLVPFWENCHRRHWALMIAIIVVIALVVVLALIPVFR